MRHHLSKSLPKEELYGFVPESGLPKGYIQVNSGGTGWGID